MGPYMLRGPESSKLTVAYFAVIDNAPSWSKFSYDHIEAISMKSCVRYFPLYCYVLWVDLIWSFHGHVRYETAWSSLFLSSGIQYGESLYEEHISAAISFVLDFCLSIVIKIKSFCSALGTNPAGWPWAKYSLSAPGSRH